MLSRRPVRLALTLLSGLAVMAAGVSLTWYQVIREERNNTTQLVSQVISTNERLLDGARDAAMQVRPFLRLGCTPDVRAELSRLAIGTDHVRVINLVFSNQQVCSSWDGAREKRDEALSRETTLMLRLDDNISPGVPVLIMRMPFPEGDVVIGMSTYWSSAPLRGARFHSPLTLRAEEHVLTEDNSLAKAVAHPHMNVVASGRYPFSVEYETVSRVPSGTLLQEGGLSLLLSLLAGLASMTVFRRWIPHPTPAGERLAAALRRGEIVPWYQPVVDGQTGIISGVEVLARWVKPDGTTVSPDRFIPEAEASGLIVPLTRMLMEKVSSDLPAILRRAGGPWHIAFNVTRACIMEPTFIDGCQVFMACFNPGSIRLTLELTEREAFDTDAALRERLGHLYSQGIILALDDFGTGYANLNAITALQVSMIKIDRAFVSRAGQDKDAERLLASIIALARAQGLCIIAEGVETEEQVVWLTNHGVLLLQGFIYSPPIPLRLLKRMYGLE